MDPEIETLIQVVTIAKSLGPWGMAVVFGFLSYKINKAVSTTCEHLQTHPMPIEIRIEQPIPVYNVTAEEMTRELDEETRRVVMKYRKMNTGDA